MTKWQLTDFHSDNTMAMKLKSKQQIESLNDDVIKQAKMQGFEQGYQEGFQKAQPEIEQLKSELRDLIAGLQEPKKLLEKEVELALVDLTLQIVRHLFCHEIEQSPDKVLSIIQSVIAMIPFSAKQKILYLNRDDLNLLSKDFSTENSELQLVIDEKLQRGDCRFESERIQINATMDARLKDIFSQLKL